MFKTIVIVSSQRSGSTWLMQVLAQAQNFRVYGEVFREITSREFRGDPELKPPLFYTEHDGSVQSYIEKLRDGDKVVVVKLMYDQIIKNPELISFLTKNNVLLINLIRRNVLDIAFSKLIARGTGVYHREDSNLEGSIHVKLSTLNIIMCKELVKNLVFPFILRLMSRNYLYYEYEQLVQDIIPLEAQLNSNFKGDGLSLDSSQTKWKKTKTESKVTSIENYDELMFNLRKGLFRRFVK